jgi:membrane protease YdiL (CAAX protease family)
MHPPGVPLNRYALIFIIANTLLTIALAALFATFDLGSGGSLTVALVIAPTFFASAAFVKDHKRPPTEDEKSSFAWRAIGAYVLTSVATAALLIGIELNPEERAALLTSGGMSMIVWIISLVLIGIYLTICYFGVRWLFGWYARIACKRRA